MGPAKIFGTNTIFALSSDEAPSRFLHTLFALVSRGR